MSQLRYAFVQLMFWAFEVKPWTEGLPWEQVRTIVAERSKDLAKLELLTKCNAVWTVCERRHCALAFGKLVFDWEKTTAEREFLSALELNPRYIQARDWYAVFYLQLAAGRLADGLAQAKLALESDPLSCYANTMLSYAYSLAGEYVGAVRSAKRAVELDSESFLASGGLHLALQLSGRFEESVAAGQAAMAMAGRHPMESLLAAAAGSTRPWDAR